MGEVMSCTMTGSRGFSFVGLAEENIQGKIILTVQNTPK